MLWRVIHDTLKWVWPALFAGTVAIAGIAIAASEQWPAAKSATGQVFARAIAMLNNPVTWVVIVGIFILWLVAFIWSGHLVNRGSVLERKGADLRPSLEGWIHGGTSSDHPGMHPVFVLVRVRNIGVEPSVASDWKIGIIDAGGEERFCMIMPSQPINMESGNGQTMVFAPSDAIVRKMETPLAVGSSVTGYALFILTPQQNAKFAKGNTVFLRMNDILDRETAVELRIEAESAPNIPYIPFAKDRLENNNPGSHSQSHSGSGNNNMDFGG